MTTEVILGPPGTGKTTTLITRVKGLLKEGVLPSQIAFLSFTKKAATEASERAMKAFELEATDLPYFRTLHSLAFRQLGVNRNQMMSWSNYRELGRLLDVEVSGKIETETVEELTELKLGDRMLHLDNYRRTIQVDMLDLDKLTEYDVTQTEFERFCETYAEYKKSRYLYDYTDLLSELHSTKRYPERIQYMMVDEAQDLSNLQWAIVDDMREKYAHTVVVGDDDQAIYQWSGANVQRLLDLARSVACKSVLSQTFRVPQTVHKLAESISARIQQREEKHYAPRPEPGTVQHVVDVGDVALDSGEWLILARDKRTLYHYVNHCETQGYHYKTSFYDSGVSELAERAAKWERMRKDLSLRVFKGEANTLIKLLDKGSYNEHFLRNIKQHPDRQPLCMRDLLRYGLQYALSWEEQFLSVENEKLQSLKRLKERITYGHEPKQPRITIATIHGVKGGEADNVLLDPTMSRLSFENLENDPDSEHRVYYVAVTRAKQNLYIMEPRGMYYYEYLA